MNSKLSILIYSLSAPCVYSPCLCTLPHPSLRNLVHNGSATYAPASFPTLPEGGATFVRTMQSIAPTRRRGAATSAWSCSRGLASCCTPLAGQPVEGVCSGLTFPCGPH